MRVLLKQKVHYMRNFILMAALMFVAAACNGVQNSSSEASAESGLQMSQMYTDDMILQRDIPLVIKGKANAGEKVKVTLEGPSGTKTKKAKASADGLWKVKMSPLKAGTGFTLTVEGEGRSYTYNNVAAGDIWVCSGQSNMFFRVWEGVDNGETPADPDLRLFNMKPRYYVNDVRWADEEIERTQNMDFYHPSTWEACDGENLRAFSAVGYHFGRMLREHLDVPIGLVCNAIGGAPAEAWIDRETLAEGYPEVLEDWFSNELLNQWCIQMGTINIGYPETGATKHPYAPSYLFETGIASMEQFPVKGIVWYQGESNDYNIPMHEKLFRLLVKGWRNYWGNQEMPFHFVQLSSLAERTMWPDFRDSQRRLAESIENCEMAVSSDLGDSLDIHPRQKRPVGERLARLSLRYDYGVDITPCGPVLKTAVLDGDKVVLDFDFAEGLTTSDSQEVRSFELAGEDQAFVPAEAVIADGKLVLTSCVAAPKYVRYAWQGFTRANLVNGDALPASTFRAEISQ